MVGVPYAMTGVQDRPVQFVAVRFPEQPAPIVYFDTNAGNEQLFA
jgi:hypothetical protein